MNAMYAVVVVGSVMVAIDPDWGFPIGCLIMGGFAALMWWDGRRRWKQR